MLRQKLFLRIKNSAIRTRRSSTTSSSSSSKPSKTDFFPETAEAVVIGGGSLGCSTLYHLAKLGVKNPVLVERNKLTSGTTWHTAGLFWRLRPSDIDIELLGYSRKLLTEILPQESGMNTGWINNGGLFVASTKQRLREYERMMTLGKAYGIKSYVLGPSETKKLYPLMNVQDVYGSLFSPEDGLIDPSSWCSSLVHAAKKMGASVFENCPARRIETRVDDYGTEKIYAVHFGDGKILKTNVVINCAGAWAPKLVQPLGVNLPTMTMHHAYVTTEKIEGARGMPNVRDHDSAIYIRTTGDALAFGGYEIDAQYWENVDDNFVFGLFDLDWNRFEVHCQAAFNRVPSLQQAGIKSTICGPLSFTPDHRPLMGECPQIRGLFFACGMELGMMMGGGLGLQAALWAVNGRPDLHMFQYDVRRFDQTVSKDSMWLKNKIHESIATMYHIHWPRDEPLAGRNMLKSPIHHLLEEDGCVFQERQGWEKPGWFVRDDKDKKDGVFSAPVLPYDFYGAYGKSKNKDYTYMQRLQPNYTWDFPDKIHEIVGQECSVIRKDVGLLDLSSAGKFYLTGPQAQTAADWIFTNGLRDDIGSTIYTCMLNEQGGIESDLTVSIVNGDNFLNGSKRDSQDEDDYDHLSTKRSFYIVTRANNQNHVLSHLRSVLWRKKFKVDLIDATKDIAVLSLVGPKSVQLIEKIVPASANAKLLEYGRHVSVKLLGKVSCRIISWSMTGNPGFELHIPVEYCPKLYELLNEHGKSLGLRNIGFRSIESITLENGIRFWDLDLRFSDTPCEALLLNACKMNTGVDFLGRNVLERQIEQGLKKKLVFVTLNGHRALHGLEILFRNGEPVGMVRRADYAYNQKCPIAVAEIKRSDKKILEDTWITSGSYEIESFGEKFPAQVHIAEPFIDT